jgi:pyruvate/2-oxoglutarate dehydrogenase complex dihydrolipoamide dehydrogenase (E3) component
MRMSGVKRYDAIVIGAGQAGVPLAKSLAVEADLHTVLIERAHVGGTCINVGCTPTKTMLASGRVAWLARRASEFGVHVGPVTVDWTAVRARKDAIVTSWRGGSERRLRDTPRLELLAGDARFTGPKAVEVRGLDGTRRTLAADRIFINAGCRPSAPPLEGLDDVGALDSTSALALETLPDRLVILGGGYIGVELGQLFRRLGSAVTIVQRESQLLVQEDADVAEEIAAILRAEGIEIVLDAQAFRAARGEDGGARLTVRTPGGERMIAGSHLLVATGRAPNTEGLNLAAAGVETDAQGYIVVTPRLETTAPGVWALGDIKGGPAFTHISYDDFRIIRTNLLRGGDRTVHDRPIPYTIFTDPQLGRVGLTEHQARAQGRAIRVAKLPMAHVARAIEIGETRGFMKAVVDSGSGEILGCAILSAEGGELMGIVQLAMTAGIPYRVLREKVFSHPTLSEALNNLFLSWEPDPIEVMLSSASYSAREMKGTAD